MSNDERGGSTSVLWNRLRWRVLTKQAIGVAVVLNLCAAGTAAAGADPSAFSTLSCNCQETAPAGSKTMREELNRGIGDGLSQWWHPGTAVPR